MVVTNWFINGLTCIWIRQVWSTWFIASTTFETRKYILVGWYYHRLPLPTLTLPIALSVCWAGVFSFLLSCISLPPLCASSPYHRIPPYLRQPAVLVRAVSHSRCLGLQFSSPPPAPFLPLSQPEWGTITSSERACSALSTISIFTESWDDRFHKVPGWGLNEIGQV